MKQSFKLLSLAFLAWFPVIVSAQIDSTKILFHQVRVFDGYSPRLSDLVDVLVVGNQIEKISKVPLSQAGVGLVVEGQGRTLIPGMIDAHVHMAFGSLTMREMMSPMLSEGLIMQKLSGSSERMLMRGFTAVRDVGGPIFPLKAAIDGGTVKGPRV